MIDHIGLAVRDLARSRSFYAAALGPLGYRVHRSETTALGNVAVLMGREDVTFVIADGEGVGEGTHVAFRADSREAVRAFHAAALGAGGRDNGGPGLRPGYGAGYFAAFVLDPDGINVEAVCYTTD